MICVLNDDNKIINIVNVDVTTADNERQYYPWNKLWEQYTDVEPFDYAKNRYIKAAGDEFARRRDATRFIDIGGATYGFDCATEDITNFFAAKDALRDDLDAWNSSGEEPKTFYKVWLSETEKGNAELTMQQMGLIQKTVRASQLEAYAWYGQIKAALLSVTEAKGKEKLEEIYQMEV